jgi:hypothetical protein
MIESETKNGIVPIAGFGATRAIPLCISLSELLNLSYCFQLKVERQL